ncbi:MAG: FAD-binding oxidoreductase [Bradymonadia bacterium]
MSASLLLAYVSAVLSLQVVLAVAFALWKRRRNGPPGRRTPGPVVAQRGAWEGWRAFTVARREYEDSAHTVCSFYLQPVDGASLPPFTPGQFLTLAVPMGDERTRTRCYSLSEGPNPSHYRISVKRVLATPGSPERPPGVCSNRLHDTLRVGDRVQARPPAGGFVLDPDTTVPSVLIAGGVGITPLLCMLRGGLAADPNRTFHLYYGVRNGAEHSFRNELEDLARRHRTFHLSVVYDQPGPGDVLGESHL